MGIIGLAVVVVLALVAILFLRKRKRSPKLKGEAVPISDPHELKQLKKSFVPPHKGKMTNSELMQLEMSQNAQKSIGPITEPVIVKEKETEETVGQAPLLNVNAQTPVADAQMASQLQKALDTLK